MKLALAALITHFLGLLHFPLASFWPVFTHNTIRSTSLSTHRPSFCWVFCRNCRNFIVCACSALISGEKVAVPHRLWQENENRVVSSSPVSSFPSIFPRTRTHIQFPLIVFSSSPSSPGLQSAIFPVFYIATFLCDSKARFVCSLLLQSLRIPPLFQFGDFIWAFCFDWTPPIVASINGMEKSIVMLFQRCLWVDALLWMDGQWNGRPNGRPSAYWWVDGWRNRRLERW